MKTFQEWLSIKENMYMGRPNGQMGPDGRVYGHASGPVAQVPGSKTWASSGTMPNASNSESGTLRLWKGTSPQVRLGYLSGVPDAEQKNYHMWSWEYLPPDVQQLITKNMESKSSFE
jgi:hypothetical protein